MKYILDAKIFSHYKKITFKLCRKLLHQSLCNLQQPHKKGLAHLPRGHIQLFKYFFKDADNCYITIFKNLQQVFLCICSFSIYSIFPVFWYHAIERPSGILPSLHRYLSEKAFGKYLRRLVSTICLLGSVQCQQMEDSTFYGWVLWGLWNIYGQPSCKEGWCFCQSMQIYLDNIQKAKKESAFKSAKNILMLGKAVILV